MACAISASGNCQLWIHVKEKEVPPPRSGFKFCRTKRMCLAKPYFHMLGIDLPFQIANGESFAATLFLRLVSADLEIGLETPCLGGVPGPASEEHPDRMAGLRPGAAEYATDRHPGGAHGALTVCLPLRD